MIWTNSQAAACVIFTTNLSGQKKNTVSQSLGGSIPPSLLVLIPKFIAAQVKKFYGDAIPISKGI